MEGCHNTVLRDGKLPYAWVVEMGDGGSAVMASI
jgi:hypothetical protein